MKKITMLFLLNQLSIILTLDFLVLYILDGVNPAMLFLTTPTSRVFLMIYIIVLLVFLLSCASRIYRGIYRKSKGRR